ncbi:MAG: prolipoprotein diacylglyceryl transferase [Chloroflexi bacterium]|nr:MAG: prolipoprotein diacylglyceryl transferase [Chloroflexota bacterium]
MGIDLPFDPNITLFGPLTLSWHGVFSVVGIVAGVWLAMRLSRARIDDDKAYSIATWGVVGGIIGARLFHVVDQWDAIYSHDPVQVIAIWNGGIAIVGAVVGGVLAGLVRALMLKIPIGFGADAAAPAIPLGMAIGRIGDLINGEHWAQSCSGLPWCVRYTNPATLGQGPYSNPPFDYVHPVTTYEMLADLAIVGLILLLYPRLVGRPGEGRLLWLFLGLYGLARFFLSFLRYAREGIGDAPVAFGLSQAQLVSLGFALLSAGAIAYLTFRGARQRAPAPA